jgi:two-component system, OmpR family, alkaline phosphatase synthesis response regulator PhoP
LSRILIVEDEAHLAEGLRFNLEAEGYQVVVVDNGEAALERLEPVRFAESPFDLMVLDVMLPGKSGFEVIAELRHAGQYLPTLMLTARGRPADVLQGFEAGADDYLPKPFELAILIARIRGLLRRKIWLTAPAAAAATEPEEEELNRFELDGRTIDFSTLEIRRGDQVFPLTLMEANLLRYLLKHEGKVVSRKAMLEEVWGVREDTDTRPIDNFIVRLRRYLEDDPANPRHLLTVRGVGYRFVIV